MNNHKPEWYTRLKKGPFDKPIFDSEMQQEVEARTSLGKSNNRKRRLNPWAVAVVTLVFLTLVFILIPSPDQSLVSSPPANVNANEPTMSEYVIDHLQALMSEDEVKQAFGNNYQAQSTRRDFSQDHKEDPNDMSTWSSVDIWRFDFGVHEGYGVTQADGTKDQEGAFDLTGIRNRNIESQLVIYWKDRRVERAIFKSMNIEGDIDTLQIGPGVEEAPPTDPPASDVPQIDPSLATPNEGIRASSVTSKGILQLRPLKDGNETIEPLGAPSCLGQETDIQFTGDYELYFNDNSGNETLIQEFKQLEMIQPASTFIPLMKLNLTEIELYLLIPRYTDCHALEFYAYGINKESGEVSSLTFLNDEVISPYWTTSPVNLPQVIDGKLVVEGGRGAGMDGATRYVYVPDLAKNQLVLESKEQIP
ncbi:hypothetical protein [Cohnella sp. WQ 127256]|uniref:hypothetical protein n=1 Tax=Cohnella sp. WQ 127256 TaxID=2938790 RepID=UPI00211956EE|nr:hypothetical protein [Cohnella sp. WQ 127256]